MNIKIYILPLNFHVNQLVLNYFSQFRRNWTQSSWPCWVNCRTTIPWCSSTWNSYSSTNSGRDLRWGLKKIYRIEVQYNLRSRFPVKEYVDNGLFTDDSRRPVMQKCRTFKLWNFLFCEFHKKNFDLKWKQLNKCSIFSPKAAIYLRCRRKIF